MLCCFVFSHLVVLVVECCNDVMKVAEVHQEEMYVQWKSAVQEKHVVCQERLRKVRRMCMRVLVQV